MFDAETGEENSDDWFDSEIATGFVWQREDDDSIEEERVWDEVAEDSVCVLETGASLSPPASAIQSKRVQSLLRKMDEDVNKDREKRV